MTCCGNKCGNRPSDDHRLNTDENSINHDSADDDNVTMSRSDFEEMKGELLSLDETLTRLLDSPLIHATVISANNEFDLSAFKMGDRMIVLDVGILKQKKNHCKIASEGVDEEGYVIVEFHDESRERLNIGLNGQTPQVKLVGKNDGTNAVISVSGQLLEVNGLHGQILNAGDTVRVNMQSKQIISVVGTTSGGVVASVKALVGEDHVEVTINNESSVVIRPRDMNLQAGDKIVVDSSKVAAIRVLPGESDSRYTLIEQSDVTWDHIAGLEEAKESFREALEFPYTHPEVYSFYNKKPPKGILLYGPPGCGKTLIAKAAANSLARIHGSENYKSGFIYVKGPEMLSKWVGVAEEEVRNLFKRGEEHYKKHNYPALLFIDEAESLLRMRGSGRSSDVESTIVPQFLSVMDGLEASHTIVMLATNQQKLLDPAVIREGRVDRHIRVNRPNAKNAVDYLNIHMNKMPLSKNVNINDLQEEIVSELFSEKRKIYRVFNDSKVKYFCLSDSLSGSMLAGLVDQATSLAMRRDLVSGKKKPGGVIIDDFKDAIETMHRAHAQLNLTFDLEDFCDLHGFSRSETTIQKVAA